MEEEKHNVDMTKLTVNQLRQRLFVKRSEALFGSQYTYLDNIPEQIEALPNFTNWESFSESWDVYWVGLDPRAMSWVAGRHNSPRRAVVKPVSIVKLDNRSKRMEIPVELKMIANEMSTPNKKFEETEEDRIISESLSGKVVIDEPDEDKAIRMIESTMNDLNEKLSYLRGIKK